MPTFYKPLAAACSLAVLVALTGCDKNTNETSTTAAADTQIEASATSLWPKVESAVKKDPEIEAKIIELLGKLTLEEKVGQLIQPELRHVTPADITRCGPAWFQPLAAPARAGSAALCCCA